MSDMSYVTSYECKETHKVGWMKRYNYASKEEKKAGWSAIQEWKQSWTWRGNWVLFRNSSEENSTNEYDRVPQGSSFLSKAHYPKNPLVFAYEKKLARLMLLVSCLHNQRW